jgi:hypothetical protein
MIQNPMDSEAGTGGSLGRHALEKITSAGPDSISYKRRNLLQDCIYLIKPQASRHLPV